MKTCQASFYHTSQTVSSYPQKSALKPSHIDFNKVLHIINSETQKQFLQTRRRKVFYETERQQRPFLFHNRKRAQRENEAIFRFQNECLSTEMNRFYFSDLNKEFLEGQRKFRASFPIRKDMVKRKKAKMQKKNQQSEGKRMNMTWNGIRTASKTPLERESLFGKEKRLERKSHTEKETPLGSGAFCKQETQREKTTNIEMNRRKRSVRFVKVQQGFGQNMKKMRNVAVVKIFPQRQKQGCKSKQLVVVNDYLKMVAKNALLHWPSFYKKEKTGK